MEMIKKRKLVAVLACRSDSSRLYAKPLQNLVDGKTILDQILDTFDSFPNVISESVIAISEGIENLSFVKFSEKRDVRYIFGSKWDIMSRLINGGLIAGATDILRVTSECPFMYWEKLEELWGRHVENNNDVTAVDGCPLGTYFEIINLETLIDSHKSANKYQKEACTQIFRDNLDKYQVEVMIATEKRLDIRLTVDYPEDLVVCREIYKKFHNESPLIPMNKIISFWDKNDKFKDLLDPYISNNGIWIDNKDCAWESKNSSLKGE